MTNEQKQLLLKDLSARLPYGVKIAYPYWDSQKGEYILPMKIYALNTDGYMRLIGDVDEGGGQVEITKYLPYLRPMSSMTEEEDKEWQYYKNKIAESCDELLEQRIAECHEFFNRKHFDYRGLIPMGLALEAPEDMYKTE